MLVSALFQTLIGNDRNRIVELIETNIAYCAIYIWLNSFEWGQYILFTKGMAVILMHLFFFFFFFFSETVFYCSNFGLCFNYFNLYGMCKKYVLSLLSAILVLFNHIESSKITSNFELF